MIKLPHGVMIRQKNGITKGQIAIDKFVFACQKGNDEILNHLFKSREVDSNAISENGKTTLTLAILHKNIAAVRILLNYGADINRTSHVYYHRDHGSSTACSYDETPLNTATRLNYCNITELLIEHQANINIQSECRLPQSIDNVKDRTALHFAAEHGNISMVMQLIAHGADVNIIDKQEESALHLACRCKKRHCDAQTKVVQQLLKTGAAVNMSNKSVHFPLYLAVFYGCEKKARILIENGADVNLLCSRDNHSLYVTALHVAAAKNRFHLAKLLLENDAKLNLTNTLNYTPLQMNLHTHGKSGIATLLILHGTDLNVVDHNGFTLMATLIRNMRLDCEILAQLLVYAGYNLNKDLWLLPEYQRSTWLDPHNEDTVMPVTPEVEVSPNIPEIVIPRGRVERLCDWLGERQSNAPSLMEVCRISIRSHLSHEVTQGSSIMQNIEGLPLPRTIISYLQLKDICEQHQIFQN